MTDEIEQIFAMDEPKKHSVKSHPQTLSIWQPNFAAGFLKRHVPGELRAKNLRIVASSIPTKWAGIVLSEHFGIPHPVLSQSYTRELLNVEPFPPYSGLYSRLLAESWDSSNLYWARVADETVSRRRHYIVWCPS